MKSPIAISLQCQLISLVVLVLALAVVNRLWAYSFALGAAVFILPNLYFTLYAFRFYGARGAMEIVRSFNRGEFGKLALTALGFALVFRFAAPIHAPSVFAGFCCFLILQCGIALRIAKRAL